LEIAYDYMNRRVEKKVYIYDNGWGTPAQVLRFVYDHWNVVLVLNGLDSNSTLKECTWGLDLSGQLGLAQASSPVDGVHGAAALAVCSE